jgi:pyrroloquinoline quinone biosynthesis protein D
VLLVPERVITPSETAVAVLELCDGTRRVRDIAAQLAEAYDADAGDILGDILPLIEALATERHVVDASAHDAA